MHFKFGVIDLGVGPHYVFTWPSTPLKTEKEDIQIMAY